MTETRDRFYVHVMYALLMLVCKTAWLRRWRPRLLWGLTFLVVGAFCGIVLFIHLANTYSDAITEQWQWIDAMGETWHCSRVVGMKAVCEQRRPGQQVRYRGDVPEPSPCTVIDTRVR